MKLNDFLTQEEKDLPKQIAKEMVKVFRLGGKLPNFKEFMTRESTKFRV